MPGRRAGTQTFAYAKELTPLMCAFVFVSAIELPVVHLLIPWDTVRLVVDIVSIWGLLWMIGLLASIRVFPPCSTNASCGSVTARRPTSGSHATRSQACARAAARPTTPAAFR